jgi:hypothetical protein
LIIVEQFIDGFVLTLLYLVPTIIVLRFLKL